MKIPVTKRFQRLMPAKQVAVQLRKAQLVIEMESWLKIFICQQFSRGLPKCLGKRREVFFAQCKTGRHFVPAKLFQMRRATIERVYKRQSFDAAPASLPQPARVECDEDRWTMILPREPGRDDAEHARMPVPRAEHDGGVAFRVERFHQFLFRLVIDCSFDGLSFAVLRIQKRG